MAQINISKKFLPLAGGTMTGDINIASGANILTTQSGVGNLGSPSAPLAAIYVDNIYPNPTPAPGTFVHISGDTMTGALNAPAISGGSVTIGSLNGVLVGNSGVVSGSATTTNLPEGSHLYYTDARARGVISGTTPITVSNGLIGITTSSATVSGSLTSTDWNTFNTGAANSSTALSQIASVSGNLVTTNSNLAIVSGIAATALQNISSSGLGISLYNTKLGTTAFINSISGLGTVSIATNSNGVVTISGVASIGNVSSVAGLIGAVLVSGAGSTNVSTVGNAIIVSGTMPLIASGTAPISVSAAGLVSISTASSTVSGSLTSTDWNIFNTGAVNASTALSQIATVSGIAATAIQSGISLGTGLPIFSDKNGTNLRFNSISGVGAVGITSIGNVIIVSGTDTGEVNTASNLGTGFGWFDSKSASDLRFKSITSGTNITIVSGVSSLQVGVSNTPTFSVVNASVVSGTTISGLNIYRNGIEIDNIYVNVSGDLMTGTLYTQDLIPTASGIYNLGTQSLPFSGLYIKDIFSDTIVRVSTISFEVPVGLINGSNPNFLLMHAPINNTLELYRDGVLLNQSGLGATTYDYNLSGSSITLFTAPEADQSIVSKYQYIDPSGLGLYGNLFTTNIISGNIYDASNLGAGIGLFSSTVITSNVGDHQFKSLIGSGITITNDSSQVYLTVNDVFVNTSGDSMTGNLTMGGVSILSSVANTSNLGSFAKPFDQVFAQTGNFHAVSGLSPINFLSSINLQSGTSIATIESGVANIGSESSPFKTLYVKSISGLSATSLDSVASSGLGVSLYSTKIGTTAFINSISGLGTITIATASNGVVTLSGSSSGGGSVSSVAGLIGAILVSGVGTVTTSTVGNAIIVSGTAGLASVTAPITSTVGIIGITTASSTVSGSLTSTDWNIFNTGATNASTALSQIATVSGVVATHTTQIANISGIAVTALQNVSSSGLGVSLYNTKLGTTAYINSISGLGTVSIATASNGVVTISGIASAGNVSSVAGLTGAVLVSGAGSTNVAVIGNAIIVSGAAILIASGTTPITVSAAGLVSITTASATVSGSLLSTDWSTFNTGATNASTALSQIATVSGTVATHTTQIANISGITATAVQNATNSGTGFVVFNSKLGTNLIFNTISGNGNVTVSSSNGIINVSGNAFSTIPVAAPITNIAGTIGITTASATVSGSLLSTDWSTFNTGATNASTALNQIATVSGVAATALQNVTSSGLGVSLFNSKIGTTAFINSISGLGTITIATASSGFIGISGTAFSGGTITSNLTPTVSGTLSIGTAALPFSGITSLDYKTVVPPLTHSGSTQTINFAAGASQKFTFLNGQPSGVTITLSGASTGSSYVLETANNASGTGFITWASGTTLWGNGVSGTTTLTSGAVDLFAFYYNGSKYIGSYTNNLL
jgi:hypothetical protein